MDPNELDALVAQIASTKKYRDVGVHSDTIRDILLAELSHHTSQKDAIQAAKKKLHEVVALYLGEVDTEQARHMLDQASTEGGEQAIKAACVELMRRHDSTRERLPLLDTFYEQIFAVTGRPQVVLDLASGLNPLALPWMNLERGAAFFAYEINRQRVDILDRFFTRWAAPAGITGQAHFQDILIDPPTQPGDVALVMKEVHRMEKRRRGCVLPLLDVLAVRWLVITLPAHSRSGRHSLIETSQRQMRDLIGDRNWPMTLLAFDSELVFCFQKTP